MHKISGSTLPSDLANARKERQIVSSNHLKVPLPMGVKELIADATWNIVAGKNQIFLNLVGPSAAKCTKSHISTIYNIS